MNISKYYKMEPGDPTSVRLEKFPSNATALKTDADGNILDAGDDAYKVKVNADDATAGFLSDKLSDTLDIEFNATADNSQLESTIFQLTGKGAALASRNIAGVAHPEGPGISGFKYGRSCTPGYAYKLNETTNTKTKIHIWIAQSSNGTLFRSYDNFKSATQDLSLVNYDNTHVAKISTSPYGAQCLAYITLPSGDNAWVNFIGSQEGYYVLNDIPANYNDDGSIVSANWVWVDVPGIPQWIGHATRITSGGIFATSSFTAGIYYTPDLVTWTKVESRGGANEVAGISSDSYGTYLAVERNSGILIRNNSELTGTFDPAAWNDITSADGFTVTTPDGITVSAEHLPVTSGYLGTWWAGLGCAYGLWVCTVARKEATSDPVYAYSDNGINWITYGGTEEDQLITVWDMGSDGAFWFGCPVGTSTPLVYQLLVNSIPARKRFVAEKGIMIVGDAFLQDTPNAKIVGTDENGRVVAKTVDFTSHGKYMPTMDPASAVSVMIPGLVGTRNEICVVLIPRIDMKVNASTVFTCAITQGGTGTLILTLRDSSYNMIATSQPITNPSGNALLSANLNELENPLTHATITEFELLSGQVYYLGINYSVNGAAYLGVVANQNMNVTPISSKKFDNLTSAPDTLSGGSETLLRPYIAITSE